MNKVLIALLLIQYSSTQTASPGKKRESLRIKTLKQQAQSRYPKAFVLFTEKDLEIIALEEKQQPLNPPRPQDALGNTIPQPVNGFRKTLTSAGKVAKNIFKTKNHIVAKFAHNHINTNLMCTHHLKSNTFVPQGREKCTSIAFHWIDSQGMLVFKKSGTPSEYLLFPLTGTNTQLADTPIEHTYEIKNGFLIIKIPIKH
jgi:hypothetical protein